MDIQDQLSRRVYHATGVDASYRGWDSVPIHEATPLLKYQPAFAGRDVLDLGVGTGRTTRYLAPLASRYEGIDFSPVMVEAARRELPWASVRLGDMRDLSAFPDESFDFVLASNNVISAVGHEDRLRVVAEVCRVLRVGGTFMFSSHNRRYKGAGAGPRLELHRNPITSIRDVLTYVRRRINHARVKRYRRTTEEYELIDDVGHDFALLHYYVDRPRAERQLEAAGLEVLDVFDANGQSLLPTEVGEDAPFLVFVAAKRPCRAERSDPNASAPFESLGPPRTPRRDRHAQKRANPMSAPTADV